MAKTTYRLTAKKVESLTAVGMHPDGAGLYLKVTSGGGKSWVLRYMLNGRPRYLGLGPLSTVNLAKARDIAGRAKSLVSDGVDPIDQRLLERARAKLAEARNLTFKDCADAFIAS